jgi:hypothetical protein
LVITLASEGVDIKALMRSFLREFKISGVVVFIMGVVWVCAYARQVDQQAGNVHLWPPIRLAASPQNVEVTALPAEVDDER